MPGKKQNNTKHYQAHEEWMKGKKLGRPKQIWVKYIPEEDFQAGGYWEKVWTKKSN